LNFINDEIKNQQAALNKALSEARSDFAASLSSANEIKKMFK
jgi:hypothetical protein